MSASKNILIPSASLILTDYLPAGEGIIAYNLLQYLSRMDNNIIAMSPKILVDRQIDNVQAIELGGLEFFPAPDEYNYLIRWRKYCKYTEKYIRAVFRNYEFDIIHHMLPVNFNQSYSPILQKPFVIGPVFHPWIDIDDSEYSGAEITASSDNFIIRKIKNRIIRYLKARNKRRFDETFKFADKIIITLDCVKKFIDKEFHHKTVKIPVGTDTSYFTPAPELPDNNTILFLAYLVKRKGLKYLIESLDIIRKRIPDVKLLVVGSGPDKDYFVKIAENLRLTGHIEFIENVGHNQTVNYFRRAQLYVLPSLCEPFGMSAVEAMSCGLPVIVTDAGGAPEVVGAHNKDYIVPARDSAALADKIMTVLFNYEKSKNLGKDNRELAVRNYDWRIIASKYNNLYEELCEQQ